MGTSNNKPLYLYKPQGLAVNNISSLLPFYNSWSKRTEWNRLRWPCRFLTSHFKTVCITGFFFFFCSPQPFCIFKMATIVVTKRSVLAEPPKQQSNIPVLTDRWEPPLDLPHSHLNNERRAGVMSNLSRRGQTSIARQGSRHALACRKSPQVLRNCPEGSMVGIKGLGLTELCCLLYVNMPKVLSVTT